MSDSEIGDYTRWLVDLWRDFADAHDSMVVAPALGSSLLGDYRVVEPGPVGPADRYLNSIIASLRRRYAPGLRRGVAVVGHSAGAQFTGRYVVLHARQVEVAVLSAPSTFPFPDPDVRWPNGRAGAPAHADWLAATQTPTVVCVGSRDTDPRPPSIGQRGPTRLERAKAWTRAMTDFAESAGVTTRIRLDIVEGAAHDEQDMTAHLQRLLDRHWDCDHDPR